MIYDTDPYLSPYRGQIDRRYRELVIRKQELAGYGRRIADAVNNHLYYGVHADRKEVVFREWAPNATAMYVIGDFNGWQKNAEYRMNPVGGGNWELRLPAAEVPHGSLFKWIVEWNGGSGERLPAYAVRCVQDLYAASRTRRRRFSPPRYGSLPGNTAGGTPVSSRITAVPSSMRRI